MIMKPQKRISDLENQVSNLEYSLSSFSGKSRRDLSKAAPSSENIFFSAVRSEVEILFVWWWWNISWPGAEVSRMCCDLRQDSCQQWPGSQSHHWSLHCSSGRKLLLSGEFRKQQTLEIQTYFQNHMYNLIILLAYQKKYYSFN